LLTDRMVIIEPAFVFLLEHATVPGRSHSPETLRTYAEYLHDWFDSLEQSDLDWCELEDAPLSSLGHPVLRVRNPA
jgi:hypothetical protein